MVQKFLKPLDFCDLQNNHGNFQRLTSSCLEGLQTSRGNFHRQNDSKEKNFYGIFQPTQNDQGNFQRHFIQAEETMEIYNVVLGKSPYYYQLYVTK